MDKYIGKMLDNRYEIIEVIGTGGMAVVYKARCHRLNRLVAVKILKDEFAQDAEFKRRFHAESQAVAMLSHANIVSVFDVSRSSEVEYIVMELIDGITLKQYMQKKGILSWREALHFTTQIVKALSHAHSRGIIHRDIKPHNIMILRDGSVKVADFGIARFTSKQNTLTQEALGSVHYISPEQARGSHIDARSDIYSVGVVLYEMITGRLPFEGDSPVSVAIQHINSMPLTPIEVNPDIPVPLEAITMKAMAPDMSKRYSSADDMLHDLEEFRKNPAISFDYGNVTDQDAGRDESEPTRKIQMAGMVSAPGRKTAPARGVNSEPDEKADQGGRRKNGTISIAAGVAAVLMFIIGMAYMLITFVGGNGFSSVDEVDVPNLLYKNIEEAKQELSENKDYENITIVENPRAFNSEYEEGIIIEQTPQYGRKIKKDQSIKVTVSKGTQTLTLPDLSKTDYKTAQIQLVQLGLNFNPPQYEASDDIVADYVIRTDPEKNSTVHAGDYITLIVSQGKKIQKVKAPDLSGMTETDAVRVLTSLNLIPGVVSAVKSDKPAREVVWQSIQPKTEIDEKTAIDFQVSLGPDPTPSPSPSVEPTQSSEPSSKTYVRKITLPSSPASVLVTVKLNDTVIHEAIHETSEGSFNISFKVKESSILRVYIDGVNTGEETFSP